METLSQGPAKGLIIKQGSVYLWGYFLWFIFLFFEKFDGGGGAKVNSEHNCDFSILLVMTYTIKVKLNLIGYDLVKIHIVTSETFCDSLKYVWAHINMWHYLKNNLSTVKNENSMPYM